MLRDYSKPMKHYRDKATIIPDKGGAAPRIREQMGSNRLP